MIVANDINGGIGKDNSLPWPRNDADMKWVRQHTKGTTLLMGNNTLKSLPEKKIPDTRYIVLTRKSTLLENRDPRADEYIQTRFLLPEAAKKDYIIQRLNEFCEQHNLTEIMLFGGKQVYELFIDTVDVLYLTTFQSEYDCDTVIDRDTFISHVPYCGYRDVSNDDVVFEIYYKEPTE